MPACPFAWRPPTLGVSNAQTWILEWKIDSLVTVAQRFDRSITRRRVGLQKKSKRSHRFNPLRVSISMPYSTVQTGTRNSNSLAVDNNWFKNRNVLSSRKVLVDAHVVSWWFGYELITKKLHGGNTQKDTNQSLTNGKERRNWDRHKKQIFWKILVTTCRLHRHDGVKCLQFQFGHKSK